MSTIGVLAFKIGFNLYSSNNKVYVIYKVSKKYINALSYITLFLISFILVLFINISMTTLFALAYVGSKMGSVTFDAIFGLVSYFIILGVIQSNYYFIIRQIKSKFFNYYNSGLCLAACVVDNRR